MEVPENLHQINVYTSAQDGQLFTCYNLLEELPGAVERNNAINTVRCGCVIWNKGGHCILLWLSLVLREIKNLYLKRI